MRRWLIPIALLGAALPARAGEHLPPVTDPAVKQACGACHMAYQPQFLPRDSWRKIIGRLPRHFGSQVALPETTRRRVEAYHLAHAADVGDTPEGLRFHASIGEGRTPLRITHVPHWLAHHRGIDREVWDDWRTGGKANCTVCHRDADAGRYGGGN